MENLKIYLTLALASFRARMEYKTSFMFYVFAILAYYLAQIGLLYVILHRFHSIQGWTMGEIAFLYGLLTFAHGFTTLFFSSLINFDQIIIKGEFDRTLIRPLSPLAQVIFSRFEASTVAHFILGTAALAIGSKLADIDWTAAKILFFPLVVAGGVLIAGSIRLMVTSVAFWTLKNESLVHTVVFSSKEFIVYPITIYNFGVQFFLTFVFPLAFINFYPAEFFLDRSGDNLFHSALQMGTPIVGIIMFAIAITAWKAGIDHYQSAGN